MSVAAFFRKHQNKVRIALFVVFAVIAVVFITNGVVSIGNKKPGYYAVELLPEAQVEAFDSGVHFMLYAQGDSNAVKRTLNEASAVYSRSLERYDKLFDAEREYEGYVNLATLNNHPGETWIVSEELFETLRDALKKTEENQGFSLFAGALYGEWRTLRYLEDPIEFDPLNDAETAERFSKIADMTGDRSHCTLQIVDEEQRAVSFDLSPEYRAFLADMEITSPVLCLGVLRDAYLVQWVARDMAAQGFDDGYLYADSGVSLMMARDDMRYTLYSCADQKVVKAGDVVAPPQTVFCQMAAFPLTENNYGFYAFDADGRTVYRHPWIDARTGRCGDLLLSAAALFTDLSPADAVYGMLPLASAENEAAIRETLLSFGDGCAFSSYILQPNAETVYTRENRPNTLTMAPETPLRRVDF